MKSERYKPMLRIGHISDIHLGYRSGKLVTEQDVNLREQDGYDALNKVIDDMIESKVDCVLCTGDFFHSPSPTIKTIHEGISAVKKLSDNHIPFYCLAGNHDSSDILKEIPSSDVLNIPEIQMYSYTEPYVVVELKDNVLLHLVSHHGYNKQLKTMENVRPIDGKINILCTHGSIYDPNSNTVLHTEAEPREIVIPQDVLNLNWNLILLGHIHERGWVIKNKVFYGGSLFRRGFSDKAGDRGWTEWVINDTDIKPILHNIPQRPQYDIVLNCNNLSIQEIEDLIANNLNKINQEEAPIVRLNFINITKINKQQINWKRFNDITKHFLSFGTKYELKEEQQLQKQEHSVSQTLLGSYNNYWQQAKDNYDTTIQTDINHNSEDYLKTSQNKVLNTD